MQNLAEKTEKMTTNDLLVSQEGSAGILTLNRPEVLNASSIPMLDAFSQTLKDWENDPSIKLVLLQGAGGKAFCAGGDVRSVYHAKQADEWDYTDQYFRKEYMLIGKIGKFPKPFISLIDGICMGGGIGLSIHGTHKILTERVKMAMPETKIGFFTDIGAGLFLNQAPGYLGTYLGLMGDILELADALYAGWGTHYVPSGQLNALQQALTEANDDQAIEKILQQFAERAPEAPLAEKLNVINDCFKFDTIEEIFKALKAHSEPATDEWLEQLQKYSPTSLKVQLALLRKLKKHKLDDVLVREFRACQRFMRGHDFFEGVRALLVDKDQSPKWSPSKISKVKDSDVKEYFTPLMEKELEV